MSAAGDSVIDALRSTSKTIRYLLLGAFINQMGYFIQAYLIVFMLTKGFSVIQAGWGLAILCGGSILGTIIGSSLGSHIGNRNAIVLSTLGMAASVAAVPILVDGKMPMAVWVASIFICGIFAQMYRPSAAMILSAHIPERQHVLGFSMFRIALNLGGAIGPLIATILAGISWSWVFWLNAICSLGYAAIALAKLPNEMPSKTAEKADENVSAAGWGIMLKDFKFWAFLWAMFLSSIVFIQFTSTVPVAIESKGLSLGLYSTLLTVYAVAIILCELKISSIVGRYPAWIPATTGTTILCLGVASFGLSIDSTWGIILSALTLVIGTMISGPTMFAYPAKFPMAVRGKYIGTTQVAFSLGNALGPLIGLGIYREVGGGVFIFCLILAIICAALLIFGMRPSSTKKEDTHVELAT